MNESFNNFKLNKSYEVIKSNLFVHYTLHHVNQLQQLL